MFIHTIMYVYVMLKIGTLFEMTWASVLIWQKAFYCLTVWFKSCSRFFTYFRRTDFIQILRIDLLFTTMRYLCIIRVVSNKDHTWSIDPVLKTLFYIWIEIVYLINQLFLNVLHKLTLNDSTIDISMQCLESNSWGAGAGSSTFF